MSHCMHYPSSVLYKRSPLEDPSLCLNLAICVICCLHMARHHSHGHCNWFWSSLLHSQAAQDGVDIVSLSITPNRRPPGIATFFNPIDMALLSAVKAGIFVVQAAGNTGPSPKSVSSFSPWIFTVGAAAHDRAYSNSIVLGNNVTIPGVGLARRLIFQNYCFVLP